MGSSVRGWFWALVGCLAAGFAFYEWLLHCRWAVLGEWGALGSALGPIAAVFSAGAVFAALRSIELQRAALSGQQAELAKQQEQIDRHMKLLEEQREQFARSADAQVKLTESQAALAKAQRDSVREAAAMRLATGTATIAALLGTQTTIQIERARTRNTPFGGQFEEHIKEAETNVRGQLLGAVHADKQLRAWIAEGMREAD
ncbi:MAG TPA: hypothetical protein VGM44_01605 [Polyangiaceae bacterium]|jgi:hypothetical protein